MPPKLAYRQLPRHPAGIIWIRYTSVTVTNKFAFDSVIKTKESTPPKLAYRQLPRHPAGIF